MAKQVPDRTLPRETQGRPRLHQQVDPVLRQGAELRARHEPCPTNISLALELVEAALRGQVPCGVVVFDAWYLAEDVMQVLARRRKAWSSVLKKNRLVETASVHLRDVHGWPLKRPGPPLVVEALVPLIPAQAYRPVTVREHTYGCLTLAVRLPGLGNVRIVVSDEQEALIGRSVVLVTNRVDWRAAKMSRLSWHRWPTATFDQDSTGPWGFHEYRMRRAEALGKHGCLVCVASSLWHVTCLPGGPDRTQSLIQTSGDACRQQGRAFLQKLLVFVHDQLAQGAPADQVFTQFLAQQRGLVLV